MDLAPLHNAVKFTRLLDHNYPDTHTHDGDGWVPAVNWRFINTWRHVLCRQPRPHHGGFNGSVAAADVDSFVVRRNTVDLMFASSLSLLLKNKVTGWGSDELMRQQSYKVTFFPNELKPLMIRYSSFFFCGETCLRIKFVTLGCPIKLRRYTLFYSPARIFYTDQGSRWTRRKRQIILTLILNLNVCEPIRTQHLRSEVTGDWSNFVAPFDQKLDPRKVKCDIWVK